VPDEHHGKVGLQLRPMLGQQVGTAVDALVIRVAEFPDSETGFFQGWNEIVPEVPRLIQAVHQDDQGSRARGRLRESRKEPVHSGSGSHFFREPFVQVVLYQHAQFPFPLGVALRPPGPEHGEQSGKKHERNDQPEPDSHAGPLAAHWHAHAGADPGRCAAGSRQPPDLRYGPSGWLSRRLTSGRDRRHA